MTAFAITARFRPSTGTAYLTAFSAAALGAGLGRAVTTTYLPLLLERVKDAPGLIGMVMLVNAGAGFFVPLVVGIWSDRLGSGGHARRLPFIAGGALLTGGGLAATALGHSSSYVVLALTGAVVYVGLNSVTTAHRALIPEGFGEGERARATSSQELFLLLGSLGGLAVGGALTGVAPWAPFLLAAVAVPLLALPTLARVREARTVKSERVESNPFNYYAATAALPGVRSLLGAQILWVLGYAAMPVFFVIYAEKELAITAAQASLWLAGFGIVTGAAVVLSGRVRDPRRYHPLLMLGVALLGAGFLVVFAAPGLAFAGVGMLAAAVGFGLISTLGFALYTSLIPQGEAGGYTALYFSVRAIASAVAVPAAGWSIAITDSYAALFVLGGAVTLAALIPLARVAAAGETTTEDASTLLSERTRERLGWWGRWTAAIGAVYASLIGLGALLQNTSLQRLDEELYRQINGASPDILWTTLNPHTRNYILLGILAVGMAAFIDRRRVPAVAALVILADITSWIALEGLYAIWERPRPEEVLASGIHLEGTWAHIASFPSGHMALTTALAAAGWLAFPKLRHPLIAYVVIVAFTRVIFGAHFPLDTIAGIVLGYTGARATYEVFVRIGWLERAQASRARSTSAVSRIFRKPLGSPS